MIEVLIGISGSGKTTHARKLQEESKLFSCIVNRDKIREGMYAHSEESIFEHYLKPNLSILESYVTKVEDDMIRSALLNGWNVIVDSTNTQHRFLNRYKNFGVSVKFTLIDTPLEVCIERQKGRNRKVDIGVIKKQYENLQNLKDSFDFQTFVVDDNKIVCDPNLSSCFIFDIDGTLAHRKDRGPFEWHRVGEDTLDVVTDVILQTLEETNKIIICTGRDGCCEQETKEWLRKHDITYNEFHIRPTNNNEKDYVIKERMWRDIATRYNILGIFDDRDQVVDRARKLGLKVFQCEYGSF